MSSLFRRIATCVVSLGLVLTSVLPAAAADNQRPQVSGVTPTSATIGQEVTFMATVTDNDSGVASCQLYVEFENQGDMTIAGSTASLDHVFFIGGVYNVFVHCVDGAGNAANGANTSVVVTTASSGGGGDSIAPVVGEISPTTAVVGVAVTLQATYSDAGGVSTCRLMVNAFDKGAMTLSNGVASKSYTFDEAISYPVHALCADSSGNTGTGQNVTIHVSEALLPPPPPPTVIPGLVKLACPVDSTVNHPCRAVYYRSTDGKRHAFPNDKIYFTWYADFSGVETISSTAMAALPLSINVTYRPGVRMVKFVTDAKVYAVGRAGLLRWVASEEIATSLYGASWNSKIDDLSDAFVSDYTFGPEIMKTSDYFPVKETEAVTTIDQNLP